jgi:hypothetical protein
MLTLGNLLTRHGENVPDQYKQLIHWLRAQRDRIKAFDEDLTSKTTLLDEQRQRLVDLGVVVDTTGVKWEEKFELLKEFKAETGHCKSRKGGARQVHFRSRNVSLVFVHFQVGSRLIQSI